jgi:signal peptidase I
VRDRLRGSLLTLGLLLLIGAAGVFLVRYRVFAVPTTSMTPVIRAGDRIVVDTWARSARRGEVVLAEDAGVLVVKRVAATGGSTAACCDGGGRLVIDGVPLALAAGPPFSVRVPGGRLFLLGDNLDASVDSRAAAATADPSDGDGTLPASAVRGRVVGLAWPPAALPDRAAGALRWTCSAGVAGVALVAVSGALSLLRRRSS